jgi:phage minor structural protein
MIPVLYRENETAFTSNGIGSLTDTIEYDVHEVLNGLYELSLIYPEDGDWAQEITHRRFIKVKPNDTSSPQPFRIYNVQVDAETHQIVVKGQHRSYDLTGIPVNTFSATGIVPALTGLISNSMIANPFTFWTDIVNTGSVMLVEEPASVRALLGGVRGSVLDTFGGEFEWDNLTVKVYARRGADNGVSIRYGLNLQNLNNERTSESFYTGCVAYYKDDDMELTGTVQEIDDAADYPTKKIFILDASDKFDNDETPTVEQLDAIAANYIISNNLGLPFKDTLTVNFVPLWQTLEFQNVAPLERVSLGDTVHVLYKDFDVAMRVIETHYNGERYTEIVLGAKKASLKETITDPISAEFTGEIANVVSNMSQAIIDATQTLAGGSGGYIVYRFQPDGVTPEELLILDQPHLEDAVHVIRFNKNGFGFSTNGYAGPYENAWTIDTGAGLWRLNADYISTGHLDGSLITAASILTNALEVNAANLINNSNENFTFGNDGLHIGRKDPTTGLIISTYQALFSDAGMRVMNQAGIATLTAEGDTVEAANLHARNYLKVIDDDQQVTARFQGFKNELHNGDPNLALFWEEYQ